MQEEYGLGELESTPACSHFDDKAIFNQTYSEQIADAIMNESSEIVVGEKFEVALKFIREQGIIYDLHQELENNHTIKDCPLCSSRRK